MSSEEAVRADAMETVVEVRARATRCRGGLEGDARERGGKDGRGDRRRSLKGERGWNRTTRVRARETRAMGSVMMRARARVCVIGGD
jgi:hypothetical protein